jgi:hypothetical protein
MSSPPNCALPQPSKGLPLGPASAIMCTARSDVWPSRERSNSATSSPSKAVRFARHYRGLQRDNSARRTAPVAPDGSFDLAGGSESAVEPVVFEFAGVPVGDVFMVDEERHNVIQ